MFEQIPVLVTAIGGGGHGEQILKALNLAEPSRYSVFGADVNPDCPQFSMVSQGLTLPSASHEEFIDVVLAVCQKFKIRAVFHGCEPELKAYSLGRQRFADAGILLPINPEPVLDLCMDKIKCANFLSSNGFDSPSCRMITSLNEVDQLADWYPLVVKPHVGSGGSKGCFIAQTPSQLGHLLSYLGISPDTPFMVQEYVGTPQEEYTVGVLHDMDGNFINSIALRRELKSSLNLRLVVQNQIGRNELGQQLVISSGISMGEVGHFPIVTDVCEKIAKALDVRGAVNIQGRLTPRGFMVFEINPRFSGTTSIRAMMGFNEPDILIRKHILKEWVIPRFTYQYGLVTRNLIESIGPKRNIIQWRSLI
ncbi:MAG: carbamoyl phosphate synthase-like protein [marine bacterium B5-7]|nr:MAG: carbamoyl phosphate synthase-like protein [marine bacterium B5-7]